VLQSGRVQVSGFGAWLTWAFVHLQFLATSSLRLSVFLQWIWTYITNQRGSRLIVNHHGSAPIQQAANVDTRVAVTNMTGKAV
jgi:NADH dehydrogenase